MQLIDMAYIYDDRTGEFVSIVQEPKIKQFQCSEDILLQGDDITLTWVVENFTKILLNGNDVTGKNSFIGQTASCKSDRNSYVQTRNRAQSGQIFNQRVNKIVK